MPRNLYVRAKMLYLLVAFCGVSVRAIVSAVREKEKHFLHFSGGTNLVGN